MTSYQGQPLRGELREIEELSRSLLVTSKERVEIIDREGRVVGINAAGRRVLETERSVAPLGRSWEQLWSESSRAAARAALDRASAGLDATFEATSATSCVNAKVTASVATGTTRRWRVKVFPLRDRSGQPARFIALSCTEDTAVSSEGAALDVDRRNAAEEARSRTERALLEREAQLELAIEHCPAPIAMFDREMRCIGASRRWRKDFRISGPVLGRTASEISADVPKRWRDVHARCLAGAVESCDQDMLVRADGSVDWLRWEIRPWCTAAREVGGSVIFAEMITEQKRALEQLRLSEERLRLAITGAALGTWHWDFRSRKLTWSDLCFAMFGLQPRSDLTYDDFRAALYPSDRAHVDEAITRAVREHSDYDLEFRIVWPDQSVHWLAARGRSYYEPDGTPTRMEGVVHDISARKGAERALREGEERFRQLAEAMPHLVWQIAPDGTLMYTNQRWSEYTGRAPCDLDASQWGEVVHPDDMLRGMKSWSEQQRGEPQFMTFRMRRHDGQYQWFSCRSVPVLDPDGHVLHVVATATDVEPLKRTEDALRESRARLDTALRAAGMGTWVWHMDSDKLQLDGSLPQLLDFSPDEAASLTMEKCLARAHPDDRAALRVAGERSREHGADFEAEFRLARKDGTHLWLTFKGRVEARASCRAPQLFGACVDVTQHKHLEEELRQAQKMEAIGQLAGGVAHDFNNLLMVILGQASLIATHPELPEPAGGALREIIGAAERAASLTAQLLAFGRRKPLQTKELELNEVVASIGHMLKRLINENIVLDIQTDPRSPRLCADPNTLAQVLLNLALNARDAMPNGGQLTIRTSHEVLDERSAQALPEARAGHWACLSVSDNGAGIPPEVLPRIFEPFFTTKAVGKGTGLGLATVYGIVKQHHGFVSVHSTLGEGTTFKVFLPLPTGAREVPAVPALPHAVNGRGELVLLVEDDAAVRTTLTSILEQHGYRLIVADDGMQALELFSARGEEIDLLLTDVVLPGGLSGAELALQLRHQNPRLRVILCSGYSADKVEQGTESLPGMTFLQKPYRTERLLTLLRSVLDKNRTTAAATSLVSLR